MFRSLSTFAIIIVFFTVLIVPAKAEKINIPINCLCKKNEVQLYGDQSENEIYEKKIADQTACSLSVEATPLLSEKDITEAKEEAAKPSEAPVDPYSDAPSFFKRGLSEIKEGLLDTAKIPVQLLQYFQVMFSKIPVKKYLPDFAKEIFEEHTVLYHAFLDETVFGKAIAKISEFQDSKKLREALEKFEKEEGCKNADNPKPSCVVQRAMCNYEKYTGVLYAEAGQPLRSSAKLSQNEELQVLLKATQKRDQALVEEAKNAQEALDTSIAVYSQFFNTYSLHLKLKELIASFVKIRNRTSSMRALVECIPNKVVGTATTDCD